MKSQQQQKVSNVPSITGDTTEPEIVLQARQLAIDAEKQNNFKVCNEDAQN